MPHGTRQGALPRPPPPPSPTVPPTALPTVASEGLSEPALSGGIEDALETPNRQGTETLARARQTPPYKVDTSRPSLRTDWTRGFKARRRARTDLRRPVAARPSEAHQERDALPDRVHAFVGTRRVRLVREEGRDVSG